ncbi:MAG: hypothetical protein ACI8WT_004587 [Clostridium sp.]|jgi:hypothetical protein
MSVTIKEVLEAYILSKKKKYSKIDKEVITNLLMGVEGNNKKIAIEKDFAFLRQDGLNTELLITDLEAEEYIIEAIKNSMKKYSKSKVTAIAVYKELITFINKKYNIKISIYFPKWIPKTTLERQLYIAKMLQNPDASISELEDILYVSSKTIQNDLKILKGDDDDSLEVMGQKLTVDFERKKGKLSFPSTIHPLFLTFNLTQVITTLEGLKIMSEKEAYKNYALNGAKTIWVQLSDYAKQRILTVSEGLGNDTCWYKSLETDITNLFHTEYMCSTIYGCESLLLCFKNSKPCFIEYIDDNGKTIIYKNCMIISNSHNQVIVKMGEKQLILETDRVVKAALTENELF